MGRLYKAVKQNPILNLKPFQKDNGDRGEKFSPLSGPHATAEAIAVQIGVSYRTVLNAAKFADAVETLQGISPQAAERVLRGEVRDALVANSQTLPRTRQGWRSGAISDGGAFTGLALIVAKCQDSAPKREPNCFR
jgi:hypothetical protein